MSQHCHTPSANTDDCSPLSLPPGILSRNGSGRKLIAPIVEFNPVAVMIDCAENNMPDAEADAETNSTSPEVCMPELAAEIAQHAVPCFSGGLRRHRRPLGLLTPSSCRSNGMISPMRTPGSAASDGAKRRKTPKFFIVQDSIPPLFEGSLEDMSAVDVARTECQQGRRRVTSLGLNTPSSCGSMFRLQLSPMTPDPERCDLNLIAGDVAAILFDFDGTLTSTPGEAYGKGKPGQRSQKELDLCARASLLAPQLQSLREAGIVLGIISKSTEATIRRALVSASLAEYFQGPILGTAVGLEGKAGFIAELVGTGALQHLADLGAVLLIDDDVRELDRARSWGIQTYPAPAQGGLQEEDFDEIFELLGVQRQPSPVADLPATSKLDATDTSALADAEWLCKTAH